ncbi:MAG: HK97 family phage prohead protease [Pseudomonadota bacterium]
MTLEKRFQSVGIKPDGSKIGGVAIPYNVETRVGGLRELVRPGAFRASLGGSQDVLALVNHDPRSLLARTRGDSLRFTDTPEALLFELDLPDTPSAAEVRGLAEAGSLGGVSIGFVVERGGERRANGLREIVEARLVEISLISAFPAYSGTSAALRDATPRLNRAAQRARVL